MEIVIDKKYMLEELEIIYKAYQQATPLVSLQGLNISATETYIKFLMSDGNLSIVKKIEYNDKIKLVKTGKLLVPSSIFRNVLKTQDNEVTLSKNNNILNITSKNSESTINLMNIDDYPNIYFNLIGSTIKVNAGKFKEMIKNVAFAASDNEEKIILNGVNLNYSNGKIKAGATNSNRLAFQTFDAESNDEFNITVYSKNLNALIPKDVNGEIEIMVDDSKINIQHKNTIIQSRLIEGIYPEIEKVIPSEFENVLTIDVRKINKIFDKINAISSLSEGVKMNIKDKTLKIEGKREEIGNILFTEKDVNWVGKDDFSIVFNSLFIKQALSKFTGEVKIKFNGEFQPISIEDDKKPELKQIILPYRAF